MTQTQAIKLAIGCIEREIKRLAANANLHDMYGADMPACIDASKRRKELRAAIDELKQPSQARML
jgi:hypothetical protein